MTLTELKALLAKATPGDWHAYSATCCPDMGGVSTGKRTVCNSTVGRFGHPSTIEDAELIAAAVNALPALLDIAEAAQAVFHPSSYADHVDVDNERAWAIKNEAMVALRAALARLKP